VYIAETFPKMSGIGIYPAAEIEGSMSLAHRTFKYLNVNTFFNNIVDVVEQMEIIRDFLCFNNIGGIKMVSITVSVPPETRELMKKFPEMNWSGFVRKSIEEKVKKLAQIEEWKSRLDEEKEFMDWSVKLIRDSRHTNSKRRKVPR
jgi:hypothetical protein